MTLLGGRALATGAGGARAQSLTQSDIRYSVIDGLQRLYCYQECTSSSPMHPAII